MKLKFIIRFFIILGILSVAPYLPAQSVAKTPSSGTGTSANTLGLGFQIGAPYGLTAKYFLNETFAIDGAAGWAPDDHSKSEIHADALFHDFDVFSPRSGRMPVYAGAGLLLRFRDSGHDNLAGFRFPIGVSYMFDGAPFDIFGEVAPEIIFSPFARGGISASAGIRFWF
jgi:hypothetical protein